MLFEIGKLKICTVQAGLAQASHFRLKHGKRLKQSQNFNYLFFAWTSTSY